MILPNVSNHTREDTNERTADVGKPLKTHTLVVALVCLCSVLCVCLLQTQKKLKKNVVIV